MLSRIGLVPRVICEILGLKAAILCHVGELGVYFILSYHEIDEIVIGAYLLWIYNEALTNRRC